MDIIYIYSNIEHLATLEPSLMFGHPGPFRIAAFLSRCVVPTHKEGKQVGHFYIWASV